MSKIIVRTYIQTPKGKYEPNIVYDVDDKELDIIGMFSDIDKMDEKKIDTKKVKKIKDTFFSKRS